MLDSRDGLIHSARYRTKDLFEEHPNKPDLWRFRGRADDVIVLSNGEKLNPVDFEKRVELHPLVKGAIVVGQSKFQTGLLVELTWDLISPGRSPADILEELWPTIEQSNQIMPKHGVVWKSKIAVTSKDKPFVRTATKGNIVRSQTVNLYAAEIEALYANGLSEDIPRLSQDVSLEAVESFLGKIVGAAGMPTFLEMSNDQDLFALGMDSLQTLRLTSMINHSSGCAITTAEVCAHPTISSLAAFLMQKDQVSESPAAHDRIQAMSDMIEKYTKDMEPRLSRVEQPAAGGHSVLLNGSTGNLGCLLLKELIKSPNIKRVFCLNRAADGQARQTQQFAERQFEVNFAKVIFLHSQDSSQDHLGLSSVIYAELLETIDLVILNAWTVDFNKSLRSFEPLVAGVRNFVDFSIASQRQAHIVLVSSVASVGNWVAICGDDSAEVPEKIIDDNRVSAPGGYGESKHVASLVLAAAAKFGVRSTVIRVGQLAGPAEEENQLVDWNQREWFPSLIASSKVLGMIPSQLGGMTSIDWVPIDLAAKAVIEIALTAGMVEKARVMHVVNPKTATWEEMLSGVRACLEGEVDKIVRVVSYAEWMEKLRGLVKTAKNAERVPGIKLLDFYEGMDAARGSLRLATTDSVGVSSTMAGLEAVSSQLMERWIRRM